MHTVATKEESGIPLPAVVASVWGGFIYEGLLAPETQRTRAILDSWGQGCIELIIAACIHLPEVWAEISRKWEAEDCDFPGVFEYEVISPLGTYIGDYLLAHNGEVPTRELINAEIRRLIDAFFDQTTTPQVLLMGKAS